MTIGQQSKQTSSDSELTSNQKKLEEELLSIFDKLESNSSSCVSELREFLCGNKNDEDLKFILDNSRDENGNTWLHCVYNCLQVVELLLKAGADPNARNKYGDTPLHLAARRSNVEVVKALIENNAKVDTVGYFGCTALHYAAKNGHKEIAEALINNGADVKVVDENGYTALHYAAENGHKEIVEALINNGADVKVVDENGYTALHYAAKNGHKEIAEALINNGADVKVVDENGYTALHWAAKNGHKETVEALINNGANVNAVNKNRHTPLYWAAKNDHTEVAKALISIGANPLLGRRDVGLLKYLVTLIKNDSSKHLEKAEEPQQGKELVDDEYELLKYSLLLHGNRPLIDIVEKDTFDDLICKWFADTSGLTRDQKKLNEKLLGILKDFLFCNSKSIDGYVTRLKDFLQNNENNKEDLKTIIDLGRGESKLTILHVLSSMNYTGIKEFMSLLLETRANPNTKDNKERTPLHYAAYSGCDENVSLLLGKGALSMPDTQGKTPLEIAIDNHNYHIHDCFLTKEQREWEEILYDVMVDMFAFSGENVSDDIVTVTAYLKSLLDACQNIPDLKVVLSLRDGCGTLRVLRYAKEMYYYLDCASADEETKSLLKLQVERLLSEAEAIDCKELDKKEYLPKSETLWYNLILNQQERLKVFLRHVDEAKNMDQLEQVVDGAIECGVRFNFPREGQLYGKVYESKYNFMDYVIKRIKEISESGKNPKVASDIVCKLVSRGAVLYDKIVHL